MLVMDSCKMCNSHILMQNHFEWCRILLVLFFVLLPFGKAYAWEPPVWERYVISLEVQGDTLPTQSIMEKAINVKSVKLFNSDNFRVGAFFVLDPPSLFAVYDEQIGQERIVRGDYSFAQAVVNSLCDITVDLLNGIFFK